MTKLFALFILYKGESSSQVLASAFDLDSFGYFERSSVKELQIFTSKLLSDRVSEAQRITVKEDKYMCHVYVTSESLVGVCVSDQSYPTRVAHTLVSNILDEFVEQVPTTTMWKEGKEIKGFSGSLIAHLKRYQTPVEADPMMNIQAELDETKIILYDTIQKILRRGELLEDLLKTSEDLSVKSQVFLKSAKKTNSCCGSWR